MPQLKELFEPISIGKMTLKNRIVFPAVGTRFANVSGEVTPYDIDHYRVRARGGASLLIVPWVLVDTTTQKKIGRHRLDSDEFIRGMNEIVKVVHNEGGKIAVQLSHGGRAVTSEEILPGKQAVAPSEAYCPPFKTTARALSLDEIRELETQFAKASLRAKLAEFDAVEYHAASGYLLSQFMSPYVNKRNDAYGGTPEKRLTFMTNIIEKTRSLVGDDYPLMVRISGDEFIAGGLTLEDNQFIARRLVESSADCIDVTMGIVESYHKAMPPMSVPPAAYIHLAEGIKRVVDVPVIGVGRINDPFLANQLIRDGKVDLAAMARAILADPELPNKAQRGEFDDIRPCIYCNRCEMATSDNVHIRCTVNPNLGNENDYRIEPTLHPKKVLVVGGGPAGLTAALTASRRGHVVELYERGPSLGGQLELSCIPPHKEEMTRLLNYLRTQIGKSSVHVHLNTEVTEKIVEEVGGDVIINASGSGPIKPRIRGVDGSNVVYSWDVLRGAETRNDVIVVGGGMVGCETAEYLATKGKNVTIVEMLPDLGFDMEPFTKIFILERFSELGVKSYKSHLVTSINEEGVETIDERWRGRKISGDTVVIAVGSASNKGLYEALKGKGMKVYNVGDSKKPSRVLEAIHESTYIACKI